MELPTWRWALDRSTAQTRNSRRSNPVRPRQRRPGRQSQRPQWTRDTTQNTTSDRCPRHGRRESRLRHINARNSKTMKRRTANMCRTEEDEAQRKHGDSPRPTGQTTSSGMQYGITDRTTRAQIAEAPGRIGIQVTATDTRGHHPGRVTSRTGDVGKRRAKKAYSPKISCLTSVPSSVG